MPKQFVARRILFSERLETIFSVSFACSVSSVLFVSLGCFVGNRGGDVSFRFKYKTLEV
jgi:ABC-type microcin C transport system permease subunit YejE